MRTPKYNSTNSAYNAGILANMSDEELLWMKNRSSNVDQNGFNARISEIGPKDETKYTRPIKDSNGNVTGYELKPNSGLEVDSNGKLTQNAIDKLIKEAYDSTPSGVEIDGKTQQEITTLIRIRAGIETVGKDGKWSVGSRNDVDWGNYLGNHSVARKLQNELNTQIDFLNKGLKDNGGDGSISPSQFEGRSPAYKTPNGKYALGDLTGVGSLFWNNKTGQPFDPFENYRKIGESYCGGDEGCLRAIGDEVDQLAAGTVTRDPDGPSRVDENGNVSGGPTSYIARLVADDETQEVYVVSEKDKDKKFYKKKKKFLYSNFKIPGQAIATASLITYSGIVLFQGAKAGNTFSQLLIFIWHWIEGHPDHHGHHSLIKNKLLYFKSVIALINAYKSGQSVGKTAFDVALPFIIAFFLHQLAGTAARRIGGSVTGWGAVLEMGWLLYDTYTAAETIKKAVQENEELKKELTALALENGYDVDTFVNSGGKICVPVEYFVKDADGYFRPARPSSFLGNTPLYPAGTTSLPVEYQTDQNGNIIYEKDPKVPWARIPKRTEIPVGVPLKPKVPAPSGGRERYGIPAPTRDIGLAVPVGFGPVKELEIDGVPQKDNEGRQIYVGIPVHGPQEEVEYTAIIDNKYGDQERDNFLKNLFSYQSSINNLPNYSNSMTGPVITNVTTIGTPSGFRPGFQDALTADINAITEISRQNIAAGEAAAEDWVLRVMYGGNSNSANDSDPSGGVQPTGVEIVDDGEVKDPVAGYPISSLSYPIYLDGYNEIIQIYKGNVSIITKPSQPYDRYI